MTNKEKARVNALVKGVQPLRKGDLAAINRIFPAYLFRVRRTGEVWTTCCGRHEIITGEMPEQFRAVLDAPHQKETRYEEFTCCHMGYMSAPPPDPKIMKVCPWCGHQVKVKELGRAGNRKNLKAWRRAVVLRQYRGALWAVAYDASKSYEGGTWTLTAAPDVTELKIYRFQPGLVEQVGRVWDWGGYTRMDMPPGRLPMNIREPFYWNSLEGLGYTAVGLGELERSFARYCQVGIYLKAEGETVQTDGLIRCLTLCAFWPRQFEMLVKLGLGEAVDDLLYRKKWNRAAFDWREPAPRKSFGLNAGELRDWGAAGRSLELLTYYKRLCRTQNKPSFEVLRKLREEAGPVCGRLVPKLAGCGLRPEKLMAYIHKEKERPGQKKMTLQTLYTQWADYIEDARLLGYDLKNPIYLTPRDLRHKHTETMGPAARIRDTRVRKEQGKRERARQKAVTDRYCYSTDRWLIRAPVGANEIAAEGKTLRHCVGGYADRHLRGETTIIFLRDRRKPGKPLVTIEMHGDKLLQIHGYENDRRAPIPPRERYEEILEPWLAWVAAGSKRDKRGRPKLPPVKKHPEA